MEATVEKNHILCVKISLRPKTWIQQSTTKIRKRTVLTYEVSQSTKGAGKAFAHSQ